MKKGGSAIVTAAIEQHTVAVLVDNEPGVLARVIGLFSGWGYHIESPTVAARGPRVRDLTAEGPHVARELALVKVAGTGEKRIESLRLADIFRAKVIDSTTESFVFELTGSTEKLNAFTSLMEPL